MRNRPCRTVWIVQSGQRKQHQHSEFVDISVDTHDADVSSFSSADNVGITTSTRDAEMLTAVNGTTTSSMDEEVGASMVRISSKQLALSHFVVSQQLSYDDL